MKKMLISYWNVIKENFKKQDIFLKTLLIIIGVILSFTILFIITGLMYATVSTITDSDILNKNAIKTYSDEKISIQYPSYMEKFDDPSGVAYASFIISDGEQVPGVFLIIFSDYAGEDLYEKSKIDLSKYGLTNMNVISEEILPILARNATKITYSYDQDPQTMGLDAGLPISMKAIRISTKINGEFIQFRFVTTENTFNRYNSDINKMIDSFKII